MSGLSERERAEPRPDMDRRAWLLRAASGPAVFVGIAGSTSLGRTPQEAKQDPAGLAARELERARPGSGP